MSNFMINRIF